MREGSRHTLPRPRSSPGPPGAPQSRPALRHPALPAGPSQRICRLPLRAARREGPSPGHLQPAPFFPSAPHLPARPLPAPPPPPLRDFYVWATASQFPNSLQKVSASYFLAQNPGTDSPAVALKLLQSPNATCPAQPAAPAQQTYTLPAGQDGANVSAAEWACDGDLQVAFPAGGTACGTGFRQTDTWLPPYSSPRITWTDASPTKYYTVVIVDRDAVNRRSPLLMAAFSNISGTQLLSGFAGNSDLPGVVPWLPYVNPMPVVNSSCHRYYVVRRGRRE